MEKRKIGKWLIVKNNRGIFLLREVTKGFFLTNFPTYLVIKGQCCTDEEWFSYTLPDTLLEVVVPLEEVRRTKIGKQEIFAIELNEEDVVFVVITDYDVIITNLRDFGTAEEIFGRGLCLDGSQVCCARGPYVFTYDGRVFAYSVGGFGKGFREIKWFGKIPVFADDEIIGNFNSVFEAPISVGKSSSKDKSFLQGGFMWRTDDRIRKLAERPEDFVILVDENLRFAGNPRRTRKEIAIGLSENKRKRRKLYAVNHSVPREQWSIGSFAGTRGFIENVHDPKKHIEPSRIIFVHGLVVGYGKKYHNPIYVAGRYVYQAEGIFGWDEIIEMAMRNEGIKIAPVEKVLHYSVGL